MSSGCFVPIARRFVKAAAGFGDRERRTDQIVESSAINVWMSQPADGVTGHRHRRLS
jgi:hypothetical protein